MLTVSHTLTLVFLIQGGQPWVVRFVKAGALPASSVVSGT